ncbi:MAG: Asp-tRNA(Asn)/Glu-tRNA(Gln) amidotransferase subunit GatC [Candidatus Eisenbacteria bacterium]|uniref:Aspartyl/glutamyl-tRNA(Asn/Gln) amidotransferase subunit C n=1 Tax=Eiseniibacteriota bacterium TaxID=2212470 RepID=A0A948RW16_UNCEI|nr:Asp-tRNA(Asn)/Glu-tRNA(Gln) amidotransferase subunit GatC [Candidatus Eisenbacteria bacterium]MBU1947755.1 Asp-tRNA(Asn)/Glu-tRNA(Gln) amidotransferase subunit GatC [Candidatus Eisenbacteria bacterium]MBU2690542.1 Asp-tRNA(Asn)/Glu-tRNA(Gln) amidotransferase subunit GatC [Candidatus Eisenbacteria bacterium]
MADSPLVDPELIRRIAHLARIDITPAELRDLDRDLGAILKYLQVLDEVDTGDAPPMAHPTGLTAPMRDDHPRRGSNRGLSLREAPAVHHDSFRVPRTVELTLREGHEEQAP